MRGGKMEIVRDTSGVYGSMVRDVKSKADAYSTLGDRAESGPLRNMIANAKVADATGGFTALQRGADKETTASGGSTASSSSADTITAGESENIVKLREEELVLPGATVSERLETKTKIPAGSMPTNPSIAKSKTPYSSYKGRSSVLTRHVLSKQQGHKQLDQDGKPRLHAVSSWTSQEDRSKKKKTFRRMKSANGNATEVPLGNTVDIVDRLLSTSGSAFVLAVLAFAIVTFGALVLQHLMNEYINTKKETSMTPVREDGTRAKRVNLLDTVWWSWCFFVDPGTQTGLIDTDPIELRTTAVIISLLGFIYMLVMLGVVVDGIRSVMMDWEATRKKVVQSGHTLVLGWSDKTLFFIKEYVLAVEGEQHDKCLVVLAPKGEAEMEDEIRYGLGSLLAKRRSGNFIGRCIDRIGDIWDSIESVFIEKPLILKGTKVICWSGNPSRAHDLMRVSVNTAYAIVVMNQSDDQVQSDMTVLSIILCLRSLEAGSSAFQSAVIAEANSFETCDVMETVGQGQVQAIVTKDLVCRIMVETLLVPDLGKALQTLIGFESSEFYLKQWPQFAGLYFGDLHEIFDGAVVVGVKSSASNVMLNPPDGYMISRDDALLVLAVSADSYQPRSQLPTPGSYASILNGTGKDSPEFLGEGAANTSHLSNILWPKKKCNKVIILGFPVGKIVETLVQMDNTLHVMCEVYLLCDMPTYNVTMELQAKGILAEDGSCNLPNIRLEHFHGSITDRASIMRLPFHTCSAVLVFADISSKKIPGSASTDVGMSDAYYCDSQCLVSMYLLADVREEYFLVNNQPLIPCTIVCEILDARTASILKESSELMSAALYFFTRELETQIFAVAGINKDVTSALRELLRHQNGTNELCVLPSTEVASVGSRLSFWDLSRKVRRKADAIVIGWQLKGMDDIELNPLNKMEGHTVCDEDRLVVMYRYNESDDDPANLMMNLAERTVPGIQELASHAEGPQSEDSDGRAAS